MEWISKIIEAAKLPTKFILSIFLVAVALLFLPQELLSNLHLKEFIDKYGLYIGITALGSGTLLFMEILIHIWKTAQNKINHRKIKKAAFERVQKLDSAEKAVLREFFLQGQNTIKLPMDHPIVAGLLSSGILRMVGSHGRMSLAGMLFSMQISDFIREHLTYELLELPQSQATQTEIEFLRNNRPSFMSSIQEEESIFNW
ncbi:superinfection exclusion B family protein [Candidatus Pacearchaeota archaeon]|nr:superinfection exclusion B family protein [Candidatus Pacearchaeota archaeon]